MKTIERFFINKNEHIDVAVPDKKFNYHYKPTEQLSKFDEVLIFIKDNGELINIGSEMIDIVLESFRDACLNILKNKALLPDVLNVGNVGYQYNLTTNNEDSDDIYLPISLWSGKLTPVFLYEKNEKIYLEICPLYPWLLEESKKEESFIEFEEFMNSYKSTVIEISNRSIIQEWLIQIEELLNKIENSHIQRLNEIS